MRVVQRELPKILKEYIVRNGKDQPLIVGCNYHTTWQSHPAMRFILSGIEENKAILRTRTTGKRFSCDVDDLLYICTRHNNDKAKRLIK